MKFRQLVWLIVSVFPSVPGISLIASAQHADIEIEVEMDGALATNPLVGEGEFGEDPNPPNVADEPGFEVDDGVFNEGETLSFNAVPTMGQHLWFWDGLGDVSFGDTADTLTIEHPLPAVGSLTIDSSPRSSTLAGFLIGVADAAGGLHQDLEFILSNNPPTDGVYLFALEMTSNAYGPSEPLYMVLGSGIDEPAIDAAVEWVEMNLIPEPERLWLLFVGAFCLILRLGQT